MPERSRLVRRGLPAAILLAVAAAVGVVRWSASGSGEEAAIAGAPSPLAVSASSLYEFDDLASMVAASDLVVRARVDTTARGRLVGDGDAAIVSRIDTLQVDEVLAGDAEAGTTLLVEEEGWLGDGTAIAVNGLAPSESGMDAIWFLDRRPDPELPGYLVINHQGRYVVDGDRIRGAAGDDPLVTELEPLGPEGLTAAVRRLSGRGG
jgi:hypothetical protein